jgi:trans-aconitate methyltransferase
LKQFIRRWLAGERRDVRSAVDVFTRWAEKDRDAGMEAHHTAAVGEMLEAALTAMGAGRRFSAIDAGCGNGWTVRRLRESAGCVAATGVDGSEGMIAKARAIDPEGDYVLADLLAWEPASPVDLVVSMEVIYYFDDPVALLRRIASRWLRPGGHAVFGIDHYRENRESLSWPRDLRVRMTTWPEARWWSAMEEAGFTGLRRWRAGAKPGAAGTLAMLVRTPGA